MPTDSQRKTIPQAPKKKKNQKKESVNVDVWFVSRSFFLDSW
jgi:hypothetical protein